MFAAKKLRLTLLIFVICFVGFAQLNVPASSGWKRVIVRCNPNDLPEVTKALGAAVLDSDTAHGRFLLNVSTTTNVTQQLSTVHAHDTVAAEDDNSVQLPTPVPASTTDTYKPPTSLGAVSNYYGAPAPSAYTGQTAVSQISLQAALKQATGNGVRVAVIDTGIDFNQPVFPAGILLPGRNYVGKTSVPSEFDDPVLAQSTSDWIELDQSTSDWIELDQSTSDWIELDQSTSDWIELDSVTTNWSALHATAPEFGHGTMSAGLVHLVAPRAEIIPLKAFDDSGASTQWIIAKAITDAVDMGADVINMSFSSTTQSQTIADAVSYAISKGVILVGAAGNDNSSIATYPASLDSVIGVAAVTAQDTKASFSNFGNWVSISAPGTHLITTFPHGFASVNGTSESAPIMAGVVALAKDSGVRSSKLRDTILNAVDRLNDPTYKNQLGSGRINASKAVND